MIFNVVKKESFEVKYLDVFIGGNAYPEDIEIAGEEFDDYSWREIFEKYPTLKGNNGYGVRLFLRINIDNGHVDNWPVGKSGRFETVKVIDEGVYILKDNDLNTIHKYEGYVPDCLDIERNGYGDYWEFKINEKGFIENWKFSQKDFNELFELNQE